MGEGGNMDPERERIFLSVKGWVHDVLRVHVSQYMIVQDKVQFRVHFVPVLAHPSSR